MIKINIVMIENISVYIIVNKWNFLHEMYTSTYANSNSKCSSRAPVYDLALYP